jgi:hypothetical protein
MAAVHRRQRTGATPVGSAAADPAPVSTARASGERSGRALARWEGTGAAQVLATLGSPAGSVAAVWLDASGKLTRPPLQRGQITAWTIAAAALAPAVLALSLLTTPWPAQHLADRRRLAAWDAVWCTIG